MKVRDVMTSPAVTIGPDTPFQEIVDQLLAHEVSGLPVVDGDGRLLGLVTEADLISKEAFGYRRRRALSVLMAELRGRDGEWIRKAASRTAAEVMTPDPDVAGPDDDLARAARRLLAGRHKRLPVVEDGRVVGIVSRADLLRWFHRSDAEVSADLVDVMRDPTQVPEDHEALWSVDDGVVRLRGHVRLPSDARLVEAAVGRVPGVVAVENALEPREAEPDWR